MATTSEPTLLAPISPVVFALVLPSSRVHKLYIYNINSENRFSPDQWFVCFHAFPSFWASLLILSSNFNLFILQSFRSKVEYLHVCVCLLSNFFAGWSGLGCFVIALFSNEGRQCYQMAKSWERESEKTTTTPIDMAVCYVLCMCVFSKNNKFPKQELEKPHMLSPGKRADPRKFFSYP